jgi:RsiW-degrading membrane proteinase PrsW (M82 family)
LLPAAAVTGLLVSVGLVAIWLWLIRRPQIFGRISVRAVVVAMMWGAFAASGAYALNGNSSIIALLGQGASIDFAFAWGPAIAAPVTEEIAKVLGVVMVVLVARSRLRTPMEGAFLGAYVGLGFEVTENFAYGLNVVFAGFGENQVADVLSLYFARAGIFALVSHTILTAIAGAGLAYLWPAHGAARVRRGTALVLTAVALHALWNSPFLYAVGWRLAVAAAIPAAFYALVKTWRRDEQSWFRRVMAREVASGTVGQVYVDNVARSLRLRRRHTARVAATYGRHAEDYQHYLDGILVDLADAISAGDDSSAGAYRAALVNAVGPRAATPGT